MCVCVLVVEVAVVVVLARMEVVVAAEEEEVKGWVGGLVLPAARCGQEQDIGPGGMFGPVCVCVCVGGVSEHVDMTQKMCPQRTKRDK